MARVLSSSKRGDEGVLLLGGVLIGDRSTSSLAEGVEVHFVDDGVMTITVDLTEVTGMDLDSLTALGVLAAESIKTREAPHRRGSLRPGPRPARGDRFAHLLAVIRVTPCRCA